jgi:hypothetical protein
MRRREFIATLGYVAAGSSGWAQSADHTRRVGIIMPFAETDADGQGRVAAFRQELQRFGWRAGENLRIEERWAADESGLRAATAESLACG